MTGSQILIVGFYAAVAPIWAALSAWSLGRTRTWAFTPNWHRRAVPAFRAFFLLTLPFEVVISERQFIPAVFAIAGLATVVWLGWRAWYLWTRPGPLPAHESVRYNTAYVAGLALFALACHSFVCLAVMLNVSVPLLLLRERAARARITSSSA